MQDVLANSELFKGMDPGQQSQLFAIAGEKSLESGDYLFLLGDHAERIYVLLKGKVEVCFPLSVGGSVKDVAVETIEAGRAFGLSALVRPYRFTLSARAAEQTRLATFERTRLLQLCRSDPSAGCAFMEHLAEVLGRRFLTMRALWAREVQRSINAGRTAEAFPERS